MSDLSDITLVVTSCGRFDLLERTLASMQPWIDRIPNRILVEDSGEEAAWLDGLRRGGFTVLANGSNLGQHKSIDRGYAQVRTDYIFHCEDDWEFTRQPNFEGARSILANGIEGHSRISSVRFLGHIPTGWSWKTSLEAEICGSVYRYSLHQATPWNAFSFNPGLFRRDLHDLIGPYSSFLSEWSIARYMHKRGYVIVEQLPEEGARHIGYGRHIPRPNETTFGKFMQRLRKRV